MKYFCIVEVNQKAVSFLKISCFYFILSKNENKKQRQIHKSSFIFMVLTGMQHFMN